MTTRKRKKVKYQKMLQKVLKERSKYDSYMLNWDVKVHFYPSVEEVLDDIATYFFINRADLLMQYPRADEVVEEFMDEPQNLYHLIDDMRSSVTDCDTYFTVRPEVAKKWKLGEETAQKKPISANFEFHGRGGGHLCVVSFEGRTVDAYDFAEGVVDDEYEEWWCQKLLAMIDEWDQCFTREAVHQEAAYQTAARIHTILEEETE